MESMMNGEAPEVARRYAPAGLHAGAPLTRIHTPADVFSLVAPQLLQAEGRLKALLKSEVEVVEAIGTYLVAGGGKRLRPLLVALGAGAVGWAKPVDGMMCAGELIHLGSLLHDDVVDEADTRRGLPAAQRIYGNAGVILTGDFCLARAVLLAAEEGGHSVVTRLAAAVTAMAEGEVLQLQRAGDLSTTLDDYLETIDKKSAALISWCAAAGPLASGDDTAAEALAFFGRQAGIAFQITDDVLDYSPATGKTMGQDLRERKLTLPLVEAMARLPGLRATLEAGEPSEALLATLVEQVRRSGALEAALAEARRRADAGIAALAVLPDGPYKEALAVLGRHLVERAV